MHSTALSTAPETGSTVRARELLVMWRNPDSREIVPIGRLAHRDDRYAFVYTVATRSVAGLRPLPGLEQFENRFEGKELPPVFLERVMDPARPDFVPYLEFLGLSRETATPWEQIVESGGERAGDTLQFMEVPTVADGWAHARFLVNGIRHVPNEKMTVRGRVVITNATQHEAALAELQEGELVELIAEDQNPKDSCSVVVVNDETPLGWVPRVLAPGVRSMLRQSRVFAEVVRTRGPETPARLRLVLKLDQPVPFGFSFDPDGQWEPRVPG